MRLRLHAVFAALVLMASAGTVVQATPAQAAVNCNGWKCDGRWPGEEGCRADQVAVKQVAMDHLGGGQATIYRSRACGAAWADFDFTTAPDYSWLFLHLWAQPAYGGKGRIIRNGSGQHNTLVAGTTKTYRTVLVSWDNSVKLCFGDGYQIPGNEYDPDPDTTGDGPSGACSTWQ
ncbi:DUF2690 domain-containing protein [Micromonospora coriariae]|nr:DUF2690 domain-containing protein [Micromonospora coriariae]